MKNNKEDFVEKYIRERNDDIINSFIKYLEDKALIK
jgi:hypothetical protein